MLCFNWFSCFVMNNRIILITTLLLAVLLGCESSQLYTSYFGPNSYAIATNERRWINYTSSIYFKSANDQSANPKTGIDERQFQLRVKGSFRFEARPDGNGIGYLLFSIKTRKPIGVIQSASLRKIDDNVKGSDTLIQCPARGSCLNPSRIAVSNTNGMNCDSRFQLQLRPQAFYKAILGKYIIHLANTNGDTFAFKVPIEYSYPQSIGMIKAIDTTIYRWKLGTWNRHFHENPIVNFSWKCLKNR